MPFFSRGVLVGTAPNLQNLLQKILLNSRQSGPQRRKESAFYLSCSLRCRESWFQMSREEYFYHLSAKRCYQWKYSVSRKKSQPVNSLTYRLFTKIKPGYLRCSAYFCCKDAATCFSYIFEKKNLCKETLGLSSCPADKQNCKCYLLWFEGAEGHLDPGISRQAGRSFSCGQCINTEKCKHLPCCYFYDVFVIWDNSCLLCCMLA